MLTAEEWDLADAAVNAAADLLDDLESARKAAKNRLRAMEQIKGVAPQDALVEIPDTLEAAEKVAVKHLEKAVKAHPLGPWVAAMPGCGAKSVGRLLGATGDPWWHGRDQRPRRNADEFKAYCGLGGVDEDNRAQRRKKGRQSNWNNTARTRFFVIAEAAIIPSCGACKAENKRLKAEAEEAGEAKAWAPPPPGCSCAVEYPLRHVYDRARAKNVDRIVDGEPIRPAHAHARGMREVMQAVAEGLFVESERLHLEWGHVDLAPIVTEPEGRPVLRAVS